mmetsp:Transcript_13023/g.35740  ORF Transcript_13023/g.35740 Transcript_13023/m.35740 type:complete len:249 (-) Transcript_13023:115-861(-)
MVDLLAHEDLLVGVALGVDVDDDRLLVLDGLLDDVRQLLDVVLPHGVLDLVPDRRPGVAAPGHGVRGLCDVADHRVHVRGKLHHLQGRHLAEQLVPPAPADLRGEVAPVDLGPEVEALGDGVRRRAEQPGWQLRDALLVLDGSAPVQVLALLGDIAPLLGGVARHAVCVVLDVHAVVVVHALEEGQAELVVGETQGVRREARPLVVLRRAVRVVKCKLPALPAQEPPALVDLLPIQALARVTHGEDGR